MIAKAHRGRSARGLARYLHGPGRRNEHVYKRRGKTLAGGVVIGGSVDVERTESADWGRVLDAAIAQRERVERGVYHVPLRAAEGDRVLADGEWRVIAERVMAAVGIDDSHPWVVVRHAADHVHVAASRISFDGSKVAKLSHDYRAIERELRAIERGHGLTQVPSPDRDTGRRTRHERVTAADSARAMRTGEAPPRTVVAELVRAARDSTAGLGRAAFEAELDTLGVQYRANEAKNGRMNGYSFAAGRDAAGELVWHAASKTGRDLSWRHLGAALISGAALDKSTARERAVDTISDIAAEWRATEGAAMTADQQHPYDFLAGVAAELVRGDDERKPRRGLVAQLGDTLAEDDSDADRADEGPAVEHVAQPAVDTAAPEPAAPEHAGRDEADGRDADDAAYAGALAYLDRDDDGPDNAEVDAALTSPDEAERAAGQTVQAASWVEQQRAAQRAAAHRLTGRDHGRDDGLSL